MRTIILSSLIAVLGSVSGAFGQVDTLELVEIGSITLPHAITNLYVQDLNGDSLQEIILTDSSYAYVYDGLSRSLLWRSPQLQRPRDLQFSYVNNDSIVDIGLMDGEHVYLFSPLDSVTIWTSPSDSTMACFAIGDEDADSINDIAIVREEPGWGIWDDARDTVWIDFYDGPGFPYTRTLYTTMLTYQHDYGWDFQRPEKALLCNLTGHSGITPSLIIFAEMGGVFSHGGVASYSTGSLHIFNLNDDSEFDTVGIGRTFYFETISRNDSLLLFALAGVYSSYSSGPVNGSRTRRRALCFAMDTLLTDYTIYNRENNTGDPTDWGGSIAGDFSSLHGGNELCYKDSQYLTTLAIPQLNILWSYGGFSDLGPPTAILRYESIFEGKQLMAPWGNPVGYKLISGDTGIITALMVQQGTNIKTCSDLNNDMDDEIFSVQGNSLRIYGLGPITGLDEFGAIPFNTFLSPNYPNPFNSQTTISFSLAEAGDVALEIFDILGRRVGTLYQGRLAAGEYRVTWDASDAPSGVYFYRLRAADTEQTRRMMLVK